MRVLIKYCGGCNPEYRREKVEEILRENFPNFEFFYSGSDADLTVLISGCRKNCLVDESEWSNYVCFDSEMSENDIVDGVKKVLSCSIPK
ncbi:hypothetical protein [Archaeoglobus sp.]